MQDSIYWDIHPSLSYNALFNFIVGNRGAGKTFGAKKHVINRFLKADEEFIYLRRFKEEVTSRLCANFFTDIQGEFPEHDLTVVMKDFFIDGKHAGYALPLSTSKILKGIPYPNVRTIIFDEFIMDVGSYRYLPDEVTMFLEFFETVARMRDNVRVYFLSNALTVTNPYFLYFDLQMPPEGKIAFKNDILIENVCKSDYIEAKVSTRFGKMTEGTAYGNYAVKNQFLRDNYDFIEKKSGRCTPLFSVRIDSFEFCVWHGIDQGLLYVSSDIPQQLRVFTLTKADHTPNDVLIGSLRSQPVFNVFLSQFFEGNVRFESMNLKNKCYDMMRLAHVY